MKKTILVSVVVGVLLIGIVSAGLVGYLSNLVSAEIEVGGPVFYLDGTRDSQYDEYYTLKMNDDDVTSSYPLLSGDEQLWFVSDVLGIDSFYDERYDIELKMKSVGGENLSLTGSISAELWIGDENNHRKERICETPILLGVSRSEEVYNLDCVPEGDDGLKNIDDDERIMLVLITDPSDIDIKIYISSSEIEVHKR